MLGAEAGSRCCLPRAVTPSWGLSGGGDETGTCCSEWGVDLLCQRLTFFFPPLLCRDQQAITGYKFCILTLEEKTATQKDLPEDVLPGRQLLGARCGQRGAVPAMHFLA